MTSGARSGLIIAIVAIIAIIAAFAFGIVDVDQTAETKLPDVEVEGGQMPKFDVEAADVDVGTTTTNVEVPTVDVGTKDVGVNLPTVDVKPADDPNTKND